MVSLYEIFKDKYGEYYISYGKKHRIDTLRKKNNKIMENLEELAKNNLGILFHKESEKLIDFKIIFIGNKKYIKFG